MLGDRDSSLNSKGMTALCISRVIFEMEISIFERSGKFLFQGVSFGGITAKMRGKFIDSLVAQLHSR